MKTAILRPGALGDIIMCLQFMPELKRQGEVTFFCHESHHATLLEFARHIVDFQPMGALDPKAYDRVIGPQGYNHAECVPGKRMTQHIFHSFAADFGLQPSFDRLVLTAPEKPKLPTWNDVEGWPLQPYITIQNKTGWSVYKEWWGWPQLVAMLREKSPDLGVVQIGGPNDPQIPGVTASLCGRSFMENLAAQTWAKFHVGLDSVFNHTTNIIWREKGRTKAIILWGSSQADMVGYPHNENVLLNLPCQPCFRQDPRMAVNHHGPCINPPGQVYEKPMHACMAGITPEMIYERVKAKL